MHGDGQRLELVSAMLDPGFYPHAPQAIELRETHISWVFLAGELAYKVKKPVVFPFLDYGSVERRRQMCHEEVRLNRRLAPQIYLDVVAIVESDGDLSLGGEDDPAAVEHAVRMRRVEEDRSLDSLLARGELEDDQVAAVARRLARFHAEASIAPAERRELGVLVDVLEENLATLREAGAEVLDESRLDAAERFTRGFLGARREELAARGRDGLVRDCHGDLRAEHVIVPAVGEIYVYDCVEFDPALRQIDVGVDLAFLVMDLAALGAEEVAARLVAGWRAASPATIPCWPSSPPTGPGSARRSNVSPRWSLRLGIAIADATRTWRGSCSGLATDSPGGRGSRWGWSSAAWRAPARRPSPAPSRSSAAGSGSHRTRFESGSPAWPRLSAAATASTRRS